MGEEGGCGKFIDDIAYSTPLKLFLYFITTPSMYINH